MDTVAERDSFAMKLALDSLNVDDGDGNADFTGDKWLILNALVAVISWSGI